MLYFLIKFNRENNFKDIPKLVIGTALKVLFLMKVYVRRTEVQ